MDDYDPPTTLDAIAARLDRIELEQEEQFRQIKWTGIAIFFGVMVIVEKLYF